MTRPDPASPAALMLRAEVTDSRVGRERGFPRPHWKAERAVFVVRVKICFVCTSEINE